MGTRIVSPSQRYVVVSRSRENIWDEPPLDNIIIDSLCHYCKILIHGHFGLKSSNIGSSAKVVTMAQQATSVVPKWNEEPSTLDVFEERVTLYVMGTKERGLSVAICRLRKMQPSWPRAEQRKEGILETAISMSTWPQASSPSGTMRHSCVETSLHRDVRITLPLRR